MAASAVSFHVHLAVRPQRAASKSSAGGHEFSRPQSGCNNNAPRVEPHGVSKKLWSSSLRNNGQRDWRTVPRPKLLPVCHQARCPTAQPSESVCAREVVDPEVARSSDLTSPHSPMEWEVTSGDACSYVTVLGGLGLLACALQFPEASSAAIAVKESSFPTVGTFAGPEPSNALSLPTWVIHVASVVEWVTAMALVWKYGDTDGKSAWKGLTWGMVPLLGGAMCACTWHFFYNAESLEVLVVLQAFLTVVGNFTMWAAAYRIWKLSQEKIPVD